MYFTQQMYFDTWSGTISLLMEKINFKSLSNTTSLSPLFYYRPIFLVVDVHFNTAKIRLSQPQSCNHIKQTQKWKLLRLFPNTYDWFNYNCTSKSIAIISHTLLADNTPEWTKWTYATLKKTDSCRTVRKNRLKYFQGHQNYYYVSLCWSVF